jgi:hypothetical protein
MATARPLRAVGLVSPATLGDPGWVALATDRAAL